MAGSSKPPSCDTKTAANLSPKAKPAEKKKRKRPSKKVPTTVLESSCTNFMNLVQKLTGSAAELTANATAKDSNSASATDTSNPHTVETSSPYSSPSCDYIDPRNNSTSSSETYYQQLLRSATMASYGDSDNDSSSHSAPCTNPNTHQAATPLAPDHFPACPPAGFFHTGVADNDDIYTSYPNSSARAIENEISPFSSAWREPLPNHSEYWYPQVDAVRV